MRGEGARRSAGEASRVLLNQRDTWRAVVAPGAACKYIHIHVAALDTVLTRDFPMPDKNDKHKTLAPSRTCFYSPRRLVLGYAAWVAATTG